MSPECHGGINGEVKRYAPAPNDVWSLGIVLLNLVVGRSPWSCARGDDPHFMRYYAGQTMLFQNIHATQKFEHIIRRALD
ncbi:Serine/threonine protein kinase, partial [Coemansia sp. RSA 2322]